MSFLPYSILKLKGDNSITVMVLRRRLLKLWKFYTINNNPRRFCYTFKQKTVLKDAVRDVFSPVDFQVFADLTFGAGGHTDALLGSAKDVKVFALDRDPEAHHHACKLASEYSEGQVVPLLGLFSDFPAHMMQQGMPPNSLDGILIETGPSCLQLRDPRRGFSLDEEGLLDMRMDGERMPDLPRAMDVINSLDSIPLSQIFRKYGEEKHAKKIAKVLVDSRYMDRPVETTSQLSHLVSKAIGTEFRTDVENRQQPACQKVFDSLRQFINNELNELNYALHVAYRYLKPGGKLVIITYSPIEDRIVRKHLTGISMDDTRTDDISHKFVNAAKWYSQEELSKILPHKWNVIHRKIQPKVEEIPLNPRSGFAKLIAACKTDPSEKNHQEVFTAKLYF